MRNKCLRTNNLRLEVNVEYHDRSNIYIYIFDLYAHHFTYELKRVVSSRLSV